MTNGQALMLSLVLCVLLAAWAAIGITNSNNRASCQKQALAMKVTSDEINRVCR